MLIHSFYKLDFVETTEDLNNIIGDPTFHEAVLSTLQTKILHLLEFENKDYTDDQIINSINDVITIFTTTLGHSYFNLPFFWSSNLGDFLANIIYVENSLLLIQNGLTLIFFYAKLNDPKQYFATNSVFQNNLNSIIEKYGHKTELMSICFNVLSLLLPYMDKTDKIFETTFNTFPLIDKEDLHTSNAISHFILEYAKSFSIFDHIDFFLHIFVDILHHQFSNDNFLIILKTLSSQFEPKCQQSDVFNLFDQLINHGILQFIHSVLKINIEYLDIEILHEILILYRNMINNLNFSRNYRLLKGVELSTFQHLYAIYQKESSIATLLIDIFILFINIESQKNNFCQLDFVLHFDEDLLLAIINEYNLKSFEEKQKILFLFEKLVHFQKYETFCVFNNADFIPSYLTLFVADANDDLVISQSFLSFLIAFIQLIKLYDLFNDIENQLSFIQEMIVETYKDFDNDLIRNKVKEILKMIDESQ